MFKGRREKYDQLAVTIIIGVVRFVVMCTDLIPPVTVLHH